jgi:hypothetical protein
MNKQPYVVGIKGGALDGSRGLKPAIFVLLTQRTPKGVLFYAPAAIV